VKSSGFPFPPRPGGHLAPARGAAAGAGSAGLLSDRLERRNLILIAAVTFSVGAIGATLVPNVGVLVLFRVVLGLAVGAAALTVPLYPSEIAPTGYEWRSLP
jgi:MFS transporter, SP family, major inositol transporter